MQKIVGAKQFIVGNLLKISWRVKLENKLKGNVIHAYVSTENSWST